MSSSNDLKINTDKVMFSFGNNAQKYKEFILKNAEDQKMNERVGKVFKKLVEVV